MALKYLFMGSPQLAATILETLCDHLHPPEAVVTQVPKIAGRGQKISSTEVEFYAKSQELTVLTTADINAEPTVAALRVFEPDVILVAAFGQIFREPILQLPKICCLNVHASLLPAYRGAAPIQWALWNNEVRTGVTLQKMSRKLDAGDILMQKECAIESTDTTSDLLLRLAKLGGEAAVEALQKIESGDFSFTPQDHAKATLAPKIEKTHALLDWKAPALRCFNQIRALQPWPVAETRLGPDRLKVFKAQIVPGLTGGIPGAVKTDARSFLNVQCGDGLALSLTEIQLENRKRLGIREFLAAYRGSFPHQKLGIT
jgi:methionyl-tRNA formyltransferase